MNHGVFFVLRVHAVRTGVVTEHRVAPKGAGSISIGSASSCDLMLPGLAPKHASVRQLGRHTLVTPELSSDAVVFLGRKLSIGVEARVDSEPFRLGDYELTVEYRT
jgi:hypothetical protein